MNGPNHDASDRHPSEARLNDLLDGELDETAEERTRRHLATCASCRDLHDRIDLIRTRARALPEEMAPSRDLWPAIATRVREGDAIEPKRAITRFGSTRGLAAAAGVAAVVAGILFFGGLSDEAGDGVGPGSLLAAEVRAMEEAYQPAIDELRALVDARELSPETRQVLEENFAVIDRAIEESRAAIEADPEGHFALQGLRRMYDTKLEVLRTVTVRQ